MSELDFIEPEDLENLKRQVAYTFIDAYGNTDGADILFDSVINAERKRIRENIMSRVTDLKSCGSSNCNCQEFAELILSYLDDEWLG